MLIEKYPAYGAVVAATILGAAIGASMQGAAINPAKGSNDVVVPSSPIREVGAGNPAASKPTDTLPMEAAVLKASFASLALQVPEGLTPPRCVTEGHVEELHATCDFAPANGMARMATVSMPADKDTFIPWSWHQEVVEIVRAMPPGDLATLLETQFEQATGARLTDATLLPTEPNAVAFGIVGHVPKIKFRRGTLTNSFCAMSFAMADNRPAKIILCSADKAPTIDAMKAMVSSFQINNKSLEIRPNSFLGSTDLFTASRFANAAGLRQYRFTQHRPCRSCRRVFPISNTPTKKS